jgi:hypothetical protein
MRTMLAGRLHLDALKFAMEEVPIPVPGPGEVLIEVKAAGVCLSDIHLIDGSLTAPGGEFADLLVVVVAAADRLEAEDALRILTTRDVSWACDLLRPAYDASGGVDGRTSSVWISGRRRSEDTTRNVAGDERANTLTNGTWPSRSRSAADACSARPRAHRSPHPPARRCALHRVMQSGGGRRRFLEMSQSPCR